MTESNLTVNVNGKETAKTIVNININKPIIINFLGGPGAGKSTTASALFTLLKLHQGIKCELVPEFAKDLVWEERHHTLKNQHYVFSKQQHRIWRVSQKVDVTITDSPILLSCIYGRDFTSEKFRAYVLEEFNSYNNINFFIGRNKRYTTYGRDQTEGEARAIDEAILDYLAKHDIPYYTIKGDITGIDDALTITLQKLERKKQFEIKRI
jgi:ABC-type uncharacterized transport system ATPase subunit